MLVVGTLLSGLGALGLLPARAAGRDLEEGRAALLEAERSIQAGSLEQARTSFRRAEARFARAKDEADHPLLWLPRAVPILGRTPDAVRDVAEIGRLMAGAGEGVTGALVGLPGGLQALAPTEGQIPIPAIRRLSGAVGRARGALEAAELVAMTMPRSLLLGPVARGGEVARAQLGRVLHVVRSADDLLGVLPSLLGEDGTKGYFVAAQSPAELRGTGGFIGAYAILTVEDGRFDLGSFQDIATLPDVPASDAPAIPSDHSEIYDRFGGAGFWRNINMTPDAPTAATMIESLYREVRGISLDGTIFVGPQALADLLEATGPVRVRALGRVLSADSAVPFLANEAYLAFGDSPRRKQALGLAAQEILERFLAGTQPQSAIRSLVHAASQAHLTLHSADSRIQSALERLGAAGRLGGDGADLFGVFTSNAGGNKVDYYVDRDIRYEISLLPSGSAEARATLRFTNRAPGGPGPSYVLDPYEGTDLGRGDSLSYLSIYCGRGCGLTGAARDGAPTSLESHRERGYRMLATYLLVHPQRSAELELALEMADVWEADGSGGTYRLRVQGQATVGANVTTVTIHAPPGMGIAASNVPMAVRGATATWTGTVSGRQEVTISFRKPLPGRILHSLGDLWS